jgi:hypothetical protein
MDIHPTLKTSVGYKDKQVFLSLSLSLSLSVAGSLYLLSYFLVVYNIIPGL